MASANIPLPVVRYRDWGALRYLFRGLARNCPFFERVFLVVSGPTQVPDWVNRGEVQVVLHSEFIPNEVLPLFNSSSIEVFLHRIPGLGEEFVYFNDDMFTVLPIAPEEFFSEGRAHNEISRKVNGLSVGVFRETVLRSLVLSEKAAGRRMEGGVVCQTHTAGCLLRSACEEAYRRVEDDLLASVSRTREDYNVNFYFYTNYQHLTGRSINDSCGLRYLRSSSSEEALVGELLNPTRKIVCINDSSTPKDFEQKRALLLETLERAFPEKSKYEK